MPVHKPGLTNRTKVQIQTVDPSTRRIEGTIKDGAMIQIAIWNDAGNTFRWPVVGETWIVRRDDGIWRLDRRVQQGQVSGSGTGVTIDTEPAAVENLAPGTMKLDSSNIVDANGHTLIVVDITGIQNGWTIRWNSTLKRFVAGP